METIIRRYFDDFKAIKVDDYIALRKRHFNHLNESFEALMPYHTMIVLSLCYPNDKPQLINHQYGLVSRYACGIDYHIEISQRMRAVLEKLSLQSVSGIGFVDVSPIDERFAALVGGLGYIGHNQFLIHPDYGTHLYLATLLISKPLVTSPNAPDDCGDCRRCIDACPTHALDGKGFHKHLCLSYLSQAKEPFDYHQISAFGSMVFGCDICQDVCPKNRNIKTDKHPVFALDEHSQLHLESLLKMSNKAFLKKYSDKAFSYRGGLVLKRNAMALYHRYKAKEHLPLMRAVAEKYKHVSWFYDSARLIIDEMEKL